VSNLSPGDKVAYFGGSGSYAQYTAVPANRVTKVPDGIGLDIAAAAMVQVGAEQKAGS
jgi:NADPH2:quinone reductase